MTRKNIAATTLLIIIVLIIVWFIQTPLSIAPSPSVTATPTPTGTAKKIRRSPTPSFSPKPTSASEQIANRLVILTNAERTKNNLSPFKTTTALTSLAREHSQDMATNNYFSHTDLTGGSPSDRAKKAGIPNKELPDGSFEIGVAENIGLITGANLTAEAVAQMQIANWMNSPGHRANILNPQYTEIGIGTALRDTSYYSTQNFR